MARFRRRPTEVEAEQFFLHKRPFPAGVMQRAIECEPGKTPCAQIDFYVITIHGQAARVVSGDWIIADSTPGFYYPCKPDIFEAMYEPVGG